MSATRRAASRRSASAQRFWFWDPSHFPRPVSPAAATFDLPAMASGFSAAARELARPLAGEHVRVERGAVYFGVDLPDSAATLARLEAAREHVINPRVENALVAWRDRYEPEAEAINARIRAYAAADLDDAALAEALDDVVALRSRQWAIHDLALVPAMTAAARFTARYAGPLGGAAAAQTLLQGYPNRATAVAERLAAFAEEARERPALAGWLQTSTTLIEPPEAVRRQSGMGTPLTFGMPEALGLNGEDERWFLTRLSAFLAEHGWRAEGWDVGDPPWSDRPAVVLHLLAQRLAEPPSEPDARRRQAASAREQATVRALAPLPAAERPAFLRALNAARAYPLISEDHNTVIDQAGMAALRSVLLRAGQRLVAAGALLRAADALWLTRDELRHALRTPSPLVARVRGRRAWRTRWSAAPPRPRLGLPLPDWAAGNATLIDFFGLGAESTAGAGEARGLGVSPGVVEGRAVIASSLAEAAAAPAASILVAPMTAPAWTPWLTLAAGVIVESGGLLSHTAVLTRELGIPCIAGVTDATRRIPSGAWLTLDAGTGVVHWQALPASPAAVS